MVYDPNSPLQAHAGLSDVEQINENLNQLRKFEAAAAEPAGQVGGMLWLDTSGTPWVLKQRNSTNTAWITLWNVTTTEVPKYHFDSNITVGNAVHGIQQGSGNGLDADTLDGYEAADLLMTEHVPLGYLDKDGTEVIIAADTEQITVSSTYVKLKEFRMNAAPQSTLKIYFESLSSNGNLQYAQIYRNGSPIGTERITTSLTYVPYTEEISGWSDTDLLQLYAHRGGGGSCYIRNFRILGRHYCEVTLD